jgi:hypothetical protein
MCDRPSHHQWSAGAQRIVFTAIEREGKRIILRIVSRVVDFDQRGTPVLPLELSNGGAIIAAKSAFSWSRPD